MEGKRNERPAREQPAPKKEPEGAEPKERPQRRQQSHEDDLIDEAGRESFPASDPPAYTPARRVGARRKC